MTRFSLGLRLNWEACGSPTALHRAPPPSVMTGVCVLILTLVVTFCELTKCCVDCYLCADKKKGTEKKTIYEGALTGV